MFLQAFMPAVPYQQFQRRTGTANSSSRLCQQQAQHAMQAGWSNAVVVASPQGAIAQESKQQPKQGRSKSQRQQNCQDVPVAANIHIALPASIVVSTMPAGEQGGSSNTGQRMSRVAGLQEVRMTRELLAGEVLWPAYCLK
jgi:hypothetical protein